MRVYLDHNSTTPIREEVRDRLFELLDEGLGNASGTHSSGRRARAILDDARELVATSLDVPESWVVFTSGGTEANNHALKGCMRGKLPGDLAVSVAEHPSVLETADELLRRGHGLQRLAVDREGALDLEQLRNYLKRPNLRLLSCMLANNETGALLAVEEVAQLLREEGSAAPLWHVDGVQALGKIPLSIREWGVDLMSLSAHKIGGPQGVGVLVRRPDTGLANLLQGGGQESGARSGTENVAGIGAAALAIELAVREQATFATQMRELSEELWTSLHQHLPSTKRVGPGADSDRLPNTVNVLFEGMDGRSLVARLDLEGLETSLGSACSSGAIEPSHVLLAMGYTPEEARSGLRLSLGRTTTHKDIHRAVDILGKVVQSMTTKR